MMPTGRPHRQTISADHSTNPAAPLDRNPTVPTRRTNPAHSPPPATRPAHLPTHTALDPAGSSGSDDPTTWGESERRWASHLTTWRIWRDVRDVCGVPPRRSETRTPHCGRGRRAVESGPRSPPRNGAYDDRPGVGPEDDRAGADLVSSTHPWDSTHLLDEGRESRPQASSGDLDLHRWDASHTSLPKWTPSVHPDEARSARIDGPLGADRRWNVLCRGRIGDYPVHQRLEDTRVAPLREAVVDGPPDTELRRHLPPPATRAELPQHTPNCSRNRSGYGPFPPIGENGPINSDSSSVSSVRAMPGVCRPTNNHLWYSGRRCCREGTSGGPVDPLSDRPVD